MLSGGQKQRIAIARAILRDAPFYCWMKQQAPWTQKANVWFRRLLKTIGGSHDLGHCAPFGNRSKADRILVMDQGKIVAQGTQTA